MKTYADEHADIANAIQRTLDSRPEATHAEREELTGKMAMLRLAATGCTDPEKLRAARNAARRDA